MRLETSFGIPLDAYYRLQPGLFGCFKIDIDTKWWKFTPYDIYETAYYLGKHLALPGIVGIIIPLLVPFHMFDNFLSVSYFFTILAAILLLSVGREFLRGLIYRFKGDYIYLPGPYVFKREAESYELTINEITTPRYKLGFVGDIMMMKEFKLEFHPDIEAFFKDVHMIVGNLEGIITDKSRFLAKQAHEEDILTQLESLSSGSTKWLLNMSNNHSEDYGNLQFNKTLCRIQTRPKFDVFGREDVCFVHNQNHDINIFSPTQWSNQKTWNYTYKYIYNKLRYVSNLTDNKKFNMLYLHWGYENEKYVRSRYKKDADALLTATIHKYPMAQGVGRKKSNRVIYPNSAHKWDFIFAHHPHVLQPIMRFSDFIVDKKGVAILDNNKKTIKYDKLAVFSAGNFTSGANIIRKKKHISGIIMKCEIGPLKTYKDKLVIGKMEWRRTKNHKVRVGKDWVKRVCVDNEKYRTYNRPFFIAGILYFLLFLAVNFINSFMY